MSINSPIWLGISAAMLLGMVALVLARSKRIPLPKSARILVLLGAALLALSAGGLSVNWPKRLNVVVMVDLSASTRTAAFRDHAALQDRVTQLLGQTPYREVSFSDEAAERTDFAAPPDANAILLFSDAEFELPSAAPPTFIVVDPNLETTKDSAVLALTPRGDRIVTTVRNPDGSRMLQFTGAHSEDSSATSAKIDPGAKTISARFPPGDAWPENDALATALPPPAHLEKWWIGEPAPSSDWRSIAPSALPTEAAEYLGASVIVLNNIAADSMPKSQQARLTQFVRDLGGGIVILGGDRAFASGGYIGSAIESLSPLASAPPSPQRQWIVLIDASGSMAAALSDDPSVTRFARATSAATQLLSRLPPDDIVAVGSFARDLRWWSQSTSVSIASKNLSTPRDLAPQGPTNLQAALESIASQIQPGGKTEIIVITDADAVIDDPPVLAGLLRQRGARLNLLATAEISQSRVPSLAVLTAGHVAMQVDARLWADAIVQLARMSLPTRMEQGPATIQYSQELANLPSRTISSWNRTWPKSDATTLGSATVNTQRMVLVASRRFGSGQVGAAAFAPAPAETEALAALVASPPRDPRFKISFSTSSRLNVTVDAIDGQQYLNDLNLTLTLGDESQPAQNATELKFTQTAPGRYEASAPPPRSPKLATVRDADHAFDRFSVGGRYAPEFDRIGNNRDAMQKLAQLTGGQIIVPSQTTPIDFHWPKTMVPVVSLFGALGAALVACGLVIWKIR